VTELREHVTQATDWREWVRKRPLLTLGAAFMIGFLLAQRR
jgi:hypothetical protein